MKNQRLFEFVEDKEQSASIFQQAELQNHQQLKSQILGSDDEQQQSYFRFKSDLRPQLSSSLKLLQYRDQQIELDLRQVDDEQEKKVLLQQVKQIKSLMKQIKQINNDLGVKIESQRQVLKQVGLYAQASLQHSKQGGEQLKQAAKYKNSSLKWYLSGTFTVAGAILGTLIPIPGVGNAIGAGVGLAIGGALGGGIQKSQNRKLRKLKFKDKDDIMEEQGDKGEIIHKDVKQLK